MLLPHSFYDLDRDYGQIWRNLPVCNHLHHQSMDNLLPGLPPLNTLPPAGADHVDPNTGHKVCAILHPPVEQGEAQQGLEQTKRFACTQATSWVLTVVQGLRQTQKKILQPCSSIAFRMQHSKSYKTFKYYIGFREFGISEHCFSSVRNLIQKK